MKLNEITDDMVLNWIDSHMHIYSTNGKLDSASFLEKCRMGHDVSEYGVIISGDQKLEPLKIPTDLKINALRRIEIRQFTVDNFDQLPTTKIFGTIRCSCDNDGLTNYIESRVQHRSEIKQTKMSLNSVATLLINHKPFVYKMIGEEDELHLSNGTGQAGLIKLERHDGYDEHVETFTNPFDLQEWVIDNLNMSDWFLD